MADNKKGGDKGADKSAKGADKGAAKPAATSAKAKKGEQKGGGAPATASAESLVLPKDYAPRLKRHYEEVVRQRMIEEFGYKNRYEVPVIDKIVLNMGVGEAVNDSKKAALAAADLALIAGQKPVVTRARKAIATFKVRENMPIGAKVTLRKTRMYEFLDRLVTIALPRVKDFRGLNGKSFDGRGNYAMGIKEHIVFPEINYDNVDQVWGMDIIVCTTARTNDEAKALLTEFGFPFRN